jgi:phage replication-related protein YjqB (UPF0714/DUF867 family)
MYPSYEALQRHQREGIDYAVTLVDRHSDVTIVAPHGGKIESHTSDIAREIAGEDFNLYLFEGQRGDRNYALLHIASEQFNEPRCISLLAHSKLVVTIHGCDGDTPIAHVGGLDTTLAGSIARALAGDNLATTLGNPRFPGVHPDNICNRGLTGMGVQLEFSKALRTGGQTKRLALAVRSVLHDYVA